VLGGGGQVMLTIARNIDRARFDMDIYCIIGGGELVPELERLGFRVRIIPAYVNGRFFRYRPFQLFRLARVLRHGRYDVVHTHLFQADVIGRIAAILAGVPAIVKSLHNMGEWKKWHHLLIDRWLSRVTNRVICCSARLRQSAIQQERLDPARVTTIYHGVDVKRFDLAVDRAKYLRQLDLDPSRRVVGTVGRPIAEKGHEHLLDAIPQILAAHPDVQFLIVGEGRSRRALMERAAREGLSQVRFIGARSDIPELLAVMDVFVFPSVLEGLGIAVLEAMAAGVPVVASDIRPISEMIAHDSTALLVEPKNPAALAAAVNRLLSDDALQRSLRSNARDRVRSEFTEWKMVRSIEAVYLDLCGLPPRTDADAVCRNNPTAIERPSDTCLA
jgi:glycosyltransferase involved in cell wall biosynthesis